jgi:hypothetical protein
MAFVQAGIAVQNTEVFEKLKNTVDQSLSAANVEKFLKAATSSGFRIREFEKLLDRSVLDKVVSTTPGAKALYDQLPASDQGQIREFYLTRIEEVDPALRGKFSKVYQYS